MKYLMMIGILVSAPGFAKAVSGYSDPSEGCVHCGDKDPKGMAGTDGELASIEGVLASLTPTVDPERLKMLKYLARKLCGSMLSDNDDLFVERGKKIVSSFMKKFDGVDNASDSQILTFLNTNKSHLYCKLPLGGEEHYMVYAVNNNQLQKLFTMFLNTLTPNMDTLAPDVNVIVGTSPDGNPETFLDLLKRKSLEQDRAKGYKEAIDSKISEFRDIYHAKYFYELEKEANSGTTVATR